MELGLAGKRAIISGATQGIGRAIAESLLDEGVAVSICARTPEKVEATVAELSNRGTIHGHVVDVADADAVRAWVTSSTEQLGGLDILVHNTSGKPAGSIEKWARNFEIDLMALVHAVDAATEALAADGGTVISIGTTASVEHFATGSNSYSALKAAVVNWTLGQAQILGPRGIRCNVVSPGPIFIDGGDWDMIRQHMAAFYESTEKAHPGGRLGTAEDVADAVVFLASARARHINGVNLTVDGGFLKRIDF